MVGPFNEQTRGARERATVKALEEAGIRVVQITSLGEWASDPNLEIPVLTAAILNSPDVKAIGYPGGQHLGNVPALMQAANKKPGDIFNFGFDQPADHGRSAAAGCNSPPTSSRSCRDTCRS